MSNQFEETIMGYTTRKSTLKPGLNFANPKNDFHNHLFSPLSNIIASCRMGEEDLEESLKVSGYDNMVEYKRAVDGEADLITRLVTEYLTDNTGDMEKFTDRLIDQAADIIQFDKSFTPDEALQVALGWDMIMYEKAKETATKSKGSGALSMVGSVLAEGAKAVGKHVWDTINTPIDWTQHNGEKGKGNTIDAFSHAMKHRGTDKGIKEMVGAPKWLSIAHNVIKYHYPYTGKKTEGKVKEEVPAQKVNPKVSTPSSSKGRSKAKPVSKPEAKPAAKPAAKKPEAKPAAKAPAAKPAAQGRSPAKPVQKPAVRKKASFRTGSLENTFLDILSSGSRGVKGIWGSSSDD